MNREKLDELASQAGFDVQRLRAPYPGGFPREDMLALESFANLIVEECVSTLGCEIVYNDNYTEKNKIISDMMELLKRHFGVD